MGAISIRNLSRYAESYCRAQSRAAHWRATGRSLARSSQRFIAERRIDAIYGTLRHVSLPTDPAFMRRYPSELSVGQAQRVIIGMAVLHRPLLLIADEPTSALDIITQSEILKLFSELNREFRMSILFISHDLLSVAAISDRVAVMDQGEIVECQAAANLFAHPAHPYTQRLIDALPDTPRRATVMSY
jgi:ABC-type dipeptide/oligopeptide/nickel transport system ATPase component